MPASTWRIPDRAERERDRRALSGFLEPSLAAEIASLPVAIIDHPARFALRADAFLYRSGELLRARWPA